MSRLSYFARETLISLRRNLLMTIAGIITVLISLVLFGGILLLSSAVDHGTEKWKHGVELEIFMKVNASKSDIDAMQSQLKADTLVKSYRYLDHKAAYEEFKRLFHDQPALIESTTPDVLPESFRVAPVTARLTEQVAAEYDKRPGVDKIMTAQQQIKNLLNATRWIRLIFFVISLALLLSSLFLIVNTIRLATFARRREIEVMRLVGASNWFVRVPFMAEGLVQGAIGAGLAFGFVWTLKVVISNVLNSQHTLFSTFRVTDSDAIGIGLLIVIIGAVIGTLGSAIGLRRFLEG
ncbi:MAG TPA: permease-like cell division protein FtsX [Acidimicrobiia bacterium]|jgi:cell division transport system permease protein|nr:permease-like cell division protein FtsX [Acidimicrobiia bacterium]